jgi:putative flippase GtrA
MIRHLTELGVQFVKYALVGGSNAVFTFLLYIVFLRILGLHYLLSFSIAWILGVLLTYIINYLWVFKPEQRIRFRIRLVKYIIVYLTSYMINLFLLKSLTERTGYDPIQVQIAILPLVVAINFLGMKCWALRKANTDGAY